MDDVETLGYLVFTAVAMWSTYCIGYAKGHGKPGDKYTTSYWRGYYDSADDIAELQQEGTPAKEVLEYVKYRVLKHIENQEDSNE